MAVSFIATEFEMEFLPHTVNYTGAPNEILLGDYNRSIYVNDSSPTMNVTSVDPNEWIFNVEFSFGVVNTSLGMANASRAYSVLSNSTYNQVRMETNYGGLGLAVVQYKQFIDILNNWSNQIW